VEDERLAVVDLDELGEVRHRLAHVDVWIARVVEHAKARVHPDVDARRLHEALVEGIDGDTAGVDLGPDRPVAEHHEARSLIAHFASPAISFQVPGAGADTASRG
jgi:hypothetical protein